MISQLVTLARSSFIVRTLHIASLHIDVSSLIHSLPVNTSYVLRPFITTDGGQSWRGLPSRGLAQRYHISEHGSFILAGFSNDPNTDVEISVDDGFTFTADTIFSSPHYVTHFASVGSSEDRVLVVAEDDATVATTFVLADFSLLGVRPCVAQNAANESDYEMFANVADDIVAINVTRCFLGHEASFLRRKVNASCVDYGSGNRSAHFIRRWYVHTTNKQAAIC